MLKFYQTTLRIKYFLFLILLFYKSTQPSFAQSRQSYFYIDPVNGNDLYNGQSASKAFKTISKAKNMVRKISHSMDSDIVVFLLEGTYYLPSSLVFDEKDAGTNGHYIIYKNYTNQKPVISGGQIIRGWKLFDKEKNIYRTNVGSFHFRQLYCNNLRCIRARTPNSETLKIIKWDTAHNRICIPKTPINTWKNFTKVEMVENTTWATHHMLLQRIEHDSAFDRVSVNPLNEFVFKLPWYFRGENYFFENAYEFLDAEGEWYLDVSNHFVYYKPRSTEDMVTATLTFPVLDPIVTVEGSDIDHMVSNIRFEGISFMESTWLRPDSFGNVEMQASQYCLPVLDENSNDNSGRPSAGIIVKNAHHIVFERCTFSNMGATALDVVSGAYNIKIVGNVFKDISGNGISVGLNRLGNLTNFSEENRQFKEYICNNIDIQNNYITRIGKDYLGSVAIMYGYTQYISITYNEIENVPYTGISAGWGWTPIENPMRNNAISYNYVHNYMRVLYDGGGIYVLSKQPHSICANNYIENMSIPTRGYGWNALYFDEGVRDFTIKNNVCEVQQDDHIQWLGMQNIKAGAKDCLIENNFTNSSTVQDNGNPIINTHYFPKADWPSEALEIKRKAGLEDPYKSIKANAKPMVKF